MHRPIFAITLLFVAACEHSGAYGTVWVKAKAKPDTCLSAWDVTKDAWEESFGEPVRESCAALNEGITVHLLDDADSPCPGAAGCTIGSDIYINAALNWHHQPSVAVHEWLHLLSACENGDIDKAHEDVTLWAGLDPMGVRGDTVEAIAVRAAPHGPCLGDPGDTPLP